MRKLSLVQMGVKQKGKIVDVLGGKALQHRFMTMGIYEGREVVKLSHFILRGPIAMRVGRSVLALGYGMASKIIVGVE
jgi:Fe2+ transport system protein FeoA